MTTTLNLKEPDMTTETHTELPWRAGPARNIVNRKGYFVANVQLGQSSSNFSEMDANLRLIVRAANSHDALVAALREIASGAPETEPDEGNYDFSNSGDVIDYGIALERYATAKIARAALSSIGGGK